MNYVFYINSFNEMEEVIYWDLNLQSNISIINKSNFIKNRFLRIFFLVHFSFKINSFINLPFKFFWFPFIDQKFKNDDPVIYVFTASWYYPKLFQYLKKKHPNSKLSFYFGDTINSKKKFINNLDVSYLKNVMDFVGSYNPGDVAEYGLQYLPMCYSKYQHVDTLGEGYPKKSIVYIGAGRNRIHLISRCYNIIKESGISCFFYIVTDQKFDNIQNKDDLIVSKIPMKYSDYIGYIESADCILEIIDTDTEGGTLRFWDAVIYNKKLITNNAEVLSSKFYKSGNIVYTKEFLDFDFLKFIKKSTNSYNYNGENSPFVFLSNIEKKIFG